MTPCAFCKIEPTIKYSVLIHKCVELTLVISDVNPNIIIDKWERIQSEHTFKNILNDS